MTGGHVSNYVNSHVWGEVRCSFASTCNCFTIKGVDKAEKEVELINLYLSGETSDCIEQLGVILDACQDAVNLLRNKQLESETLGTQPDSYKIDDAMEAQQAAHEMAHTDDNEVQS